MEEKERLAVVEKITEQNTHRIDEHDKKIDELEKTYSIMEKMDYRMGNVESSLERVNEKLDENSQDKGKKWDKLIDYIFYAFVAVVLGLFYTKLGLK